MMSIKNTSVLPFGFKANGVNAGIKNSTKLDLALFYSEVPAKAACLFTTNKIVAAPLIVSKKYLKNNSGFRAVIVNSGNANCFTGSAGIKDAEAMTKAAADCLGLGRENVFVSSTGVIGKKLPIEKIRKAIPSLVCGLSKSNLDKAIIGIMTTDTFKKVSVAEFKIGGKKITICGIAKGAGMIAPNMATLLSYIFTDADISKRALNKALKIAVGNSFNCITVDGCMSTNDTVLLLANGLAENKRIDEGGGFNLFLKALENVCLSLAQLVVRDAEGGTKFITIKVSKAKNFEEAKLAALAIANSNLFKTAMFGENPNFGRIVAAVGACGIEVKEKDLKIKVSSLNKKDIDVKVEFKRGNSSAVIYTSDLTTKYIKINAEYN